MDNRTRFAVVVGSLLLALGITWIATQPRTYVSRVRMVVPPSPASELKPRPVTPPGTKSDVMAKTKPSSSASPIDQLLALLESGSATESDIEALKRALLAADTAQATSAILEFLASGRDARTGLDFTLRPGGELTAPTLRVLLMDVLGRIGQRDGTDAAAKLARETLEKKDSPDEWAIALRNLAWREPAATRYLSEKARELMTYAPWRAAPTGGMLEAFDVIVFTKDASFTPDLAAAQSDPNSALRHAAEVALDRLAAASPLDVMTYLNTHSAILAERPMLRADYFAKADLAIPGQKTALEYYLGRPDIAATEKAKLLKALATPASFVSENLLTTTPAAPDDTARERVILAATREWLTGNRFPPLQSQLLTLQRRLARE